MAHIKGHRLEIKDGAAVFVPPDTSALKAELRTVRERLKELQKKTDTFNALISELRGDESELAELLREIGETV